MTSDLHPARPLSAASSHLQLSQTAAAVGGASRDKQQAAAGGAGDDDSGEDEGDDDDDQLLDVTSRLNLQLVLVPSRMKTLPEVQPEAEDPPVCCCCSRQGQRLSR